MAGEKEKEKIMLNMSDLQIAIAEHETKINTTEDVNGRFHMQVHAIVCIHMYQSGAQPCLENLRIHTATLKLSGTRLSCEH